MRSVTMVIDKLRYKNRKEVDESSKLNEKKILRALADMKADSELK